MRAIQTEYQGVTFRSRLEARWAVAFCGMGIDTVFEPEGYEYPDGRYLPDFATVHDNVLFSIKPAHDRVNLTAAWLRELEWQRVLIAHGLPLWIIAGVPAPGQYAALAPDGDLTECSFADCRRCDGVCLCGGLAWHQIGKHTCGDHDREPCDGTRVLNAMRTAMAERFGERKRA
jgi:hypothetical protein